MKCPEILMKKLNVSLWASLTSLCKKGHHCWNVTGREPVAPWHVREALTLDGSPELSRMLSDEHVYSWQHVRTNYRSLSYRNSWIILETFKKYNWYYWNLDLLCRQLHLSKYIEEAMKKLQMWNLILTNDAKPTGWSRELRIPDQLVVKEVVPWP